MTELDPYRSPAALVAQAEYVASRRAQHDPFGPWAQAHSIVCLARMSFPDQLVELEPVSGDCEELLTTALQAVDEIPAGQRRPSHSLDRAYIAGALAQVRELAA